MTQNFVPASLQRGSLVKSFRAGPALLSARPVKDD
jgi:hypothetical protein